VYPKSRPYFIIIIIIILVEYIARRENRFRGCIVRIYKTDADKCDNNMMLYIIMKNEMKIFSTVRPISIHLHFRRDY